MLMSHKIRAVNRVYKTLDEHMLRVKNKINISCEHSCGECCRKNDIDATILEYFPAAFHLFETDNYEYILDRIDSDTTGICVFFNAFFTEGNCSVYDFRGLLCRLFGYSVKYNKSNLPVLVTCKTIKNQLQYNSQDLTKIKLPEISSYYMKLYGIDPLLMYKTYPINIAIKKAIEMVVLHFVYRNKKLTG